MTKKLVFPENVLGQHLVVLGKTGAGKSSALRHIVEHLLHHNKRVCVIDPKGDWNGLKVAADGKSAGFPVILFGDFKETAGKQVPADVPLNEFSGKHIAELVTSGNRPCVVGFRGWTQGNMHKFWIDFASTIFNSNEGELYLVIDEVHNFAPKGKIMSPEVGMCLHWANRIMNEGRGIGLVNLIASQRPQKVHNDTLTACETLVAMRVIHKADRDAVEDWIKGCGDEKQGKEVLNSLAGMKRGEAYVWSPEVDFGPERLTFPLFETFDSFAPPQLQKKVSGKDWASVDLDEVRTKLAAVIEKAKQTDPKELQKIVAEGKKRIAELERKLTQAGTAKQASETIKTVEKPVLKDAQLTRLEKSIASLSGTGTRLAETGTILITIAREIQDAVLKVNSNGHQHPAQTEVYATNPRPVHVPVAAQPKAHPPVAPAPRAAPRAIVPTGEGLDKFELTLLRKLADRSPVPTTRSQLFALCGFSIKSSNYPKKANKLVEGGYAEDASGGLILTDAGRDHLGSDYEPAPTSGDEALRHWIQKLPAYESGMLAAIAHAGELTSEEIAQATNRSLTSSAFPKAIRNLQGLQFIEGDDPYRLGAIFLE